MPFEALIFPGYLRVITKEIPKCKRLEFIVPASHYDMHMMCVWPRFRFMEVRTNRIVLVPVHLGEDWSSLTPFRGACWLPAQRLSSTPRCSDSAGPAAPTTL